MPPNLGHPALERVKPLFVCLGVPKAATTWIHRQLEAHPEVGCTHSKEINFWSSNYDRGHAWYVGQFPQDRNYSVYAEVSVGYLREEPLARLARDAPDTRFMVSLRNPYERSWSSYWQSVRTGSHRGPLQSAVDELPKIIQDSMYSAGVEAYLRYFARERLHVGLYDDLQANPTDFVRQIYAFMGVHAWFASEEISVRVNEGRRYSLMDQLLDRTQRVAKRLGVKRVHLMRLGLQRPLEHLHRGLADRRPIPKMGSRERAVLNEYLEPEIRQLQNLVDRDLSHWLADGT